MSALTSEGVRAVEGLALEGVPVGAIARAFGSSSSIIRDLLQDALEAGTIVEIPVSDWPPGSPRMTRQQMFLTKYTPDDFIMAVRKVYGLTLLEANFLRLLTVAKRADKAKLHMVAQQLRVARGSKPDSFDDTDPKMVDVVICHLRKKLTKAGLSIQTLWGSGYFLDDVQKKTIVSAVETFFNVQDQEAANDNTPATPASSAAA